MALVAMGVAVLLAASTAGPETAFAGPGKSARPLRGSFDSVAVVQVQNHLLEQTCSGGPFAGADTTSTGRVSHLGQVTTEISTAWNWGNPATGDYTPTVPATDSSATVVGAHAFSGQQVFPSFGCNIPWETTGIVTLTAANGDKVTGTVEGGEIYELGFAVPGDGQESFIEVMITGGTGRFAGATGSFVTHSIIDLVTGAVLSSEILPGGVIGY